MALITRTRAPFDELSSVTELTFATHTCEPMAVIATWELKLSLSALALITRTNEPLLALSSVTESRQALLGSLCHKTR